MLWKHGGKLCLAESWRKSNRISILKRLHALHLNALWPRQKVKTIEKLRKIVAVRYLEQSEYLTSDEFPKRWMLYIQKSGFLSGANWSQDLLFWPQQIQTVLPSKSMHRQRCAPHKYIYCDDEESKILLIRSLSHWVFHNFTFRDVKSSPNVLQMLTKGNHAEAEAKVDSSIHQ